MAGSCRRKRRKKFAKAWKEFQAQYDLSDGDAKLARSTGFSIDQLLKKFETEEYRELPIRQAISRIFAQQQKLRAQQQASSKKKKPKPKKSFKHDPKWAKAKKLCRLNQEDIRKAKELGLSPKSLTKNILGPNQQWKLPVKHWIAELYEKRFAAKATGSQKKKHRDSQPKDTSLFENEHSTPFAAYLAGDFAALHAFECERDGVDPYSGMNESTDDGTNEIPF